MADDLHSMPDESPEEQLFYEEPPRSSRAEGIGVFLALISLAIIGYAGYLWLTPGREVSELFSWSLPARTAGQTSKDSAGMSIDVMEDSPEISADESHGHAMDMPSMDHEEDKDDMPGMDMGAAGSPADDDAQAVHDAPPAEVVTDAGSSGQLIDDASFTDNRCSVCGMFTDRSPTRVIVRWNDGSYTQHDCFDCAFSLLGDGRLIDSIQVTAWTSDGSVGTWLDARSAAYLYDTKTLKGSMPPYVAAFGSMAEAEAARDELGGEALDFGALAARWQK